MLRGWLWQRQAQQLGCTVRSPSQAQGDSNPAHRCKSHLCQLCPPNTGHTCSYWCCLQHRRGGGQGNPQSAWPAMRVVRQGRPGRAERRARPCTKQPSSGQPRTQGGQLSAITAVPCHSWAPGGYRRAGHRRRRQRCPGALHWGHMHIDGLCTGPPPPPPQAEARRVQHAWQGGRGGHVHALRPAKTVVQPLPAGRADQVDPIRQQARLALTLTTRYCRVQLPLVTVNKPPDAAASAATVTAVFPGSRAVLQQQQSKSKGRGAGLQSAKGGGQRLLRHPASPQTAQPK